VNAAKIKTRYKIIPKSHLGLYSPECNSHWSNDV